MSAFRFRLQPLLDQAIERRDEAEKSVRDKEGALRRLRAAIAALEERVDARAALHHQRRDAFTRFSGNGAELRQQEAFLRRESADLGSLRHDLFLERLKVADGEEELMATRAVAAEERRKVETLEKYRDKLLTRFRRAQEEAEESELSEIASTLYIARKRS
jgi:flagellar biosynthesis chaperone FliJ